MLLHYRLFCLGVGGSPPFPTFDGRLSLSSDSSQHLCSFNLKSIFVCSYFCLPPNFSYNWHESSSQRTCSFALYPIFASLSQSVWLAVVFFIVVLISANFAVEYIAAIAAVQRIEATVTKTLRYHVCDQALARLCV